MTLNEISKAKEYYVILSICTQSDIYTIYAQVCINGLVVYSDTFHIPTIEHLDNIYKETVNNYINFLNTQQK